MQIIKRDTDYAIRGLLYLARTCNDVVSCAELAEACDMPKTFAHKIFKKMVNTGILTSRTGRTGGFQLAKKSKQVFLHDIVEAVQGPVSVSSCVLDANACENRGKCPLSAQWRKLQRRITAFLDDTSLHDMLVLFKPLKNKGKK